MKWQDGSLLNQLCIKSLVFGGLEMSLTQMPHKTLTFTILAFSVQSTILTPWLQQYLRQFLHMLWHHLYSPSAGEVKARDN